MQQLVQLLLPSAQQWVTRCCYSFQNTIRTCHVYWMIRTYAQWDVTLVNQIAVEYDVRRWRSRIWILLLDRQRNAIVLVELQNCLDKACRQDVALVGSTVWLRVQQRMSILLQGQQLRVAAVDGYDVHRQVVQTTLLYGQLRKIGHAIKQTTWTLIQLELFLDSINCIGYNI